MIWNFILYLLYGLAFFTLGLAILSRDIKLSEMGIARIIWLLAVFGIVHGFHEWLELLEQLNPDIKSTTFSIIRLGVVSISFLFLFYFGLFLNIITLYGDQALKTTPKIVKGLVGISALSLTAVAAFVDFGSGTDIYIRRLLAFPGGLLSGIGLMKYSKVVRTFSKAVATNFILAGTFMICYAFLTGVVPSDVIVPYLNVKIVLFRGASALLIMFFTIRGLSVFSLEQRELVNEKLLRFSQSEKLTSMGILAAGIAHEINNPLINVALNAEMLKDLVGDDARILKKINAIERNTDPKQNAGWGRKGDTGKGGYANNDNADKSAPAFMNLNGTEEDMYYVIPSKKIPFVDNFKAGDIVPGIEIAPMMGGRADILSRSNYADGVWTLEVMRALKTEGENADTQDVQFIDMNKSYPFGIAVFDNSQIDHLYHTETLEMKFK